MSDAIKKALELLLPPVLAGVIAFYGAFAAVQTDIAVLTSNQEKISKDIAVIHDLRNNIIKNEGRLDLLTYRVDNVTVKANKY